MANLKDLKNRIGSVKSTQKITKAMKMVAASKLRRAQERVEAARPYGEKMQAMLQNIASAAEAGSAPALLAGRVGAEKTHLIAMVSSDRGLCGGLNTNAVKRVKQRISELEAEGKQVIVMTLGRKGREQLQATNEGQLGDNIDTSVRKQPDYEDAQTAAKQIIDLFEAGSVDAVSLVYNIFHSPLEQEVSEQALIPLVLEETAEEAPAGASALYEYEPGENEILEELLPQNIAVQIYGALLENAASEHGARMTAMDNATRNAGDMIDRLTLEYNRTRQAAITTELIEIISGAEAL